MDGAHLGQGYWVHYTWQVQVRLIRHEDRRTPNGYRIDVSTNGVDWDKVLEDNTTLALPEFTDDEARVGKTYHYRVFPLYASRPGPATQTTVPWRDHYAPQSTG